MIHLDQQARLSYFFIDFFPYIFLNILAFLFFIYALRKIVKSEEKEKKKRIILAIASALWLFVVVFSIFEAHFRYKLDESDSLGYLKINRKWFKRHVVYNNYQFRDRDFMYPKKNGVIRIGVIGDSITLGYGIKNVEDRYSNVLEKMLKDAKFNLEVYNLGKSGYDTHSEIDEYQRIKQLDFDIIVLGYFMNDAQPKEKSKGTAVLLKAGAQGFLGAFFSRYSYFLDYVYWRVESRYDKTFRELRNADIAAYKDRVNFERHEKEIEDFVKQIHDENRKIVVVIFPFFYSLPNYPAYDIDKTMRMVFKKNNVDGLVDILDDVKDKYTKDLIVSKFDYHPNEAVQKIIAKRLFDLIVPLLNAKNNP